jgi:hypothetical protein
MKQRVDWLGSFVEQELRAVIAWKQHNLGEPRDAEGRSHDDGSNYASKAQASFLPNDSHVQVTQILSLDTEVIALVSDGFTSCRAFLAPEVVEQIEAEIGEELDDNATGDVISVREMVTVSTPLGTPDDCIYLKILKADYQFHLRKCYAGATPIEHRPEVDRLIKIELMGVWQRQQHLLERPDGDVVDLTSDDADAAHDTPRSQQSMVASQASPGIQTQLHSQGAIATQIAIPRKPRGPTLNNDGFEIESGDNLQRPRGAALGSPALPSRSRNLIATVDDKTANMLKILNPKRKAQDAPPGSPLSKRPAQGLVSVATTKNMSPSQEVAQKLKAVTSIDQYNQASDLPQSQTLLNHGDEKTSDAPAAIQTLVDPIPVDSTSTHDGPQISQQHDHSAEPVVVHEQQKDDHTLIEHTPGQAPLRSTSKPGVFSGSSEWNVRYRRRRIPAAQKSLLEQQCAWCPSLPGKSFPHPNVPVELLTRWNSKASVEVGCPKSPVNLPGDPGGTGTDGSPADGVHSDTSEEAEDPDVDDSSSSKSHTDSSSNALLSGWPEEPSPGPKAPELPPDSSLGTTSQRPASGITSEPKSTPAEGQDPVARVPWSREEDQILLESVRSGLNSTETSRQYNLSRSPASVRNRKMRLRDKNSIESVPPAVQEGEPPSPLMQKSARSSQRTEPATQGADLSWRHYSPVDDEIVVASNPSPSTSRNAHLSSHNGQPDEEGQVPPQPRQIPSGTPRRSPRERRSLNQADELRSQLSPANLPNARTSFRQSGPADQEYNPPRHLIIPASPQKRHSQRLQPGRSSQDVGNSQSPQVSPLPYPHRHGVPPVPQYSSPDRKDHSPRVSEPRAEAHSSRGFRLANSLDGTSDQLQSSPRIPGSSDNSAVAQPLPTPPRQNPTGGDNISGTIIHATPIADGSRGGEELELSVPRPLEQDPAVVYREERRKHFAEAKYLRRSRWLKKNYIPEPGCRPNVMRLLSGYLKAYSHDEVKPSEFAEVVESLFPSIDHQQNQSEKRTSNIGEPRILGTQASRVDEVAMSGKPTKAPGRFKTNGVGTVDNTPSRTGATPRQDVPIRPLSSGPEPSSAGNFVQSNTPQSSNPRSSRRLPWDTDGDAATTNSRTSMPSPAQFRRTSQTTPTNDQPRRISNAPLAPSTVSSAASFRRSFPPERQQAGQRERGANGDRTLSRHAENGRSPAESPTFDKFANSWRKLGPGGAFADLRDEEKPRKKPQLDVLSW